MATATSFVFDGFEVQPDKRTVMFNYVTKFAGEPDVNCQEKWVFPLEIDAEQPVIQNLLTNLAIAVGASYYKTFLAPKFEFKHPILVEEADFWNTVYRNGLAEFLYVNQIKPEHLATFEGVGDAPPAPELKLAAGAWLGLGGGKDSIVAGEMLKSLALPVKAFVQGTGPDTGQTKPVATTMGVELSAIDRQIDPQLATLNQRTDALNGHVPISVMFAFAGLILAVSSGMQYVVVANEASASADNVVWEGLAVNHQWSKSLAFEKLLQTFVQKHVSPSLNYFSAIRPLSSVAIAKLFSHYPQYLADFTSCNLVFRIDPAQRPAGGHWCGSCPKCLSSFIILAPWLDQTKLLEIFGQNLMEKPELEPLFLELIGAQGHKPLDCVGTPEELVLSLNLALKQKKFFGSYLVGVADRHKVLQNHEWTPDLTKDLALRDEQAFPVELADRLLETLTAELAK